MGFNLLQMGFDLLRMGFDLLRQAGWPNLSVVQTGWLLLELAFWLGACSPEVASSAVLVTFLVQLLAFVPKESASISVCVLLRFHIFSRFLS